jgi:hypothetical protein
MPRSNPHARERVMDDEKHLDALASFVPFAGRETSGVSSAGSSRESTLQALSRASVTKRCSRRNRVGALLVHRGILDSGLSARADGEAARKSGAHRQPARLALSDSSAFRKERRRNENRSDGKVPVVLSCGESRAGPHRRFVAVGQAMRPRGLPEKRGTGLSKGSCSRSYRRGRNRTNGVVVVDARSTGKPRRRAESKRSEGQPSRRE